MAQMSEAKLMRTCGHLYVSIALESLGTTLMSLVFAYLLLLITNKGRLASPARAAWNFVSTNLRAFVDDVSSELSRWSEMKTLPLEKRFAFCRKTNQAICLFQIFIGILTIERWLHIRNVNGFRYLGYAITCPPMQTELVILIAPVVPCFKTSCVTTYFITMAMLIVGYAASLLDGDLYEGSVQVYRQTGRFADLGVSEKGWCLIVSMACQVYLSFIQIPMLAVLYCMNGGERNGLPHGYLKLLAIVAVTWLAFPAWWMLSYEGMSVIKDTKMNAAGFTVLNLLSKGSFTLTMLAMAKWHRREKKRQDFLDRGMQSDEALKAADKAVIEDGGMKQEVGRRNSRRTETWVVKMLRPFDHMETAPQDWQELPLTFRAFLVGNGITPDSWRDMSSEARGSLNEEYDLTVEMVEADDPRAIQKASRSDASLVTSPQEASQEPRASGLADARAREPVAAREASAEDTIASPSEGLAEAIKVGQMLTTLHGAKGRVVSKSGRLVQLSVKDKPVQTVRIQDVTVLKVIFLSARGLQNTAFPEGGRAYGTCALRGRPSSEVQGPLGGGGSKVSWDHQELDLLGYSAGDSLTCRVWGLEERTKADELLGEATIEGSELIDGGFEGELQLTMDSRRLPAYVSVMVVAVNLPELLEAPESSDDDSFMPVPLPRPLALTAKSDRVTCCF